MNSFFSPDMLFEAHGTVSPPSDTDAPSAALPARACRAISIEIVTPGYFLTLERAWRDLVRRAAIPNVFMEPTIAAAAQASSEAEIHVVLAWHAPVQGGIEELLGAWALAVARPSSGLPIRVLKAPIHGHAALGLPVVAEGWLDPVLNRMLQAVLDAPGLPKIFEINAMHAAGPVAEALQRVLLKRDARSVAIDPRTRPELARDAPAAAAPLSRNRVKSLRRKRRRLEALGEVSLVTSTARADVSKALDAFLRLEASGWKGKRRARGRAILGDPALTEFFQATIEGLAERGLASIASLRLDGRPAAMQIVVTCGRTAYTWKSTYDETLRHCAPGLILLQEITADFAAREDLDTYDSCTHRADCYMAEYWSGRLPVHDLVFDARTGTRASFLVLSSAEHLHWQAKIAMREVRDWLQRSADRAGRGVPEGA